MCLAQATVSPKNAMNTLIFPPTHIYLVWFHRHFPLFVRYAAYAYKCVFKKTSVVYDRNSYSLLE